MSESIICPNCCKSQVLAKHRIVDEQALEEKYNKRRLVWYEIPCEFCRNLIKIRPFKDYEIRDNNDKQPIPLTAQTIYSLLVNGRVSIDEIPDFDELFASCTLINFIKNSNEELTREIIQEAIDNWIDN